MVAYGGSWRITKSPSTNARYTSSHDPHELNRCSSPVELMVMPPLSSVSLATPNTARSTGSRTCASLATPSPHAQQPVPRNVFVRILQRAGRNAREFVQNPHDQQHVGVLLHSHAVGVEHMQDRGGARDRIAVGLVAVLDKLADTSPDIDKRQLLYLLPDRFPRTSYMLIKH